MDVCLSSGPEGVRGTMKRVAETRRASLQAIGVGAIAGEYLSVRQLSQYAGLSVRTLRMYIAHRTQPLPSYRIGGKILVRRSDFDTWASQFRRDATGVDAIVDDIMQGLG